MYGGVSMSNTQERQVVKLRWQGLARVVMCCLALGLLAGCTSSPGGVSATETIHVNGYYAPRPSLDVLIEESPVIVAGRVVDFRYDILYDTFDYPDGETPLPPEAMTVVTVEVTRVLAGGLEPGDRVEVHQMGGVLDKVMRSYDQVPYLADHVGEDLVLFLRTWDYPQAKTTPYGLADSFEGAWLDDSESLSLLWGVAYAYLQDPDYEGPGAGAPLLVPGASEFPVKMTIAELEQAIAEHK
jgi:hypothetical protein